MAVGSDNKMSSKLGRKGDPRMHRAVAARLTNPDLSLYDALCTGGFDYSTNDDKSFLDAKKVTLGQRKNQLSRRLRLARKQAGGQANNSCSPTNAMSTPMPNEVRAEENKLNDKPNTSHDTLYNNRKKVEFTNDLVTAGYNNNIDGDNGNAIGVVQQSKKQRFTKCLNSTTFDSTCAIAPVTNQKLNTNQLLHQGWQLGNMQNIGGDDVASNAFLTAAALLGPTPGVNYASAPFFTSQITNGIPDQPVQRYQPQGPSAVALSSLAATAQTVGLTLEQLALTLSSNTPSLSKLVAETRSGESMAKQEQLALDLYLADVKPLYTKCLLVAGVDASLAEQNTPTYIRFATKAWEDEGNRLRNLQDTLCIGSKKRTNAAANPADRNAHGTPNTINKSDKDCNTSDNRILPPDCNGYSQSHNHNHSHRNHNHNHSHHNHNHNHSHHQHQHKHNDGQHTTGSEFGNDATDANVLHNDMEHTHDNAKCDARHMHRIGECGHRAIIHQPKHGTAHIDFIVNDQVECYSGQDSMSLAGRSLDSAWPSKYKCKEVEESCAKACGKNVPGPFDSNFGHLESLVAEPKIFKLSDIDTEDPEWTFDANEDVDGGVMGLFKLGRESSS